MLKKLQDLLAQVRAAEKSAIAIWRSGEVGSKIDGTMRQLRRMAADIEERIRMLKEHEQTVSAKRKSNPPGAEAPPEE